MNEDQLEIRLARIEEKITYMLNMMEELFESYEAEEPEENQGNEGWIENLDSWKDSYNED